ncbi:MAG TPA: YraN family protein [Longimicrobiales bacterium]|nr:YraN family protein [Longimicrobiales bacterium]
MSEVENPGHALGRWGEGRAARFLERRGWTILARNYRFGRREVDLVVLRDGLLAFVEVKTRAGTGFGSPQDSITLLKRREIEAVAAQFVDRHRLHALAVRFDAMAILVRRRAGGSDVIIEHVEDAWRPGWP